ncbi:DUF502 domain-containing protein [Rhodophyticola sp. CCM32]|uniref:DUF502 domain-containing protein n=1 Tax=Rhodophyticola sp. CCM32 TaxID=2916397 RepID=UPI00107F8448|nr:DUF502 domain-containing protein [Rhodophyticola sp. CCM32]QBY00295.1 DUF502 domain-containing protein [Rhodophyticola sp. CCM32]
MQLPETPPPPKRGFFSSLRANFLTGLVVIAPIGLTVWLIWSVIGWVDGWVLPFIPNAYNPVLLIRHHTGLEVDVRGLGVATFLIFTVIIGWTAKGLIGRSLIKWAESLVLSVPGVRTLYSGVKQIVETVVSQGEQNFDKACLVEYPRAGIWAIAFISTTAKGEIAASNEQEMVSVFLPTTPNPTSGFLLFVPRRDVQVLDMSVEDAAKLVISAGLVYPNGQTPAAEPQVIPAKTPDAAE